MWFNSACLLFASDWLQDGTSFLDPLQSNVRENQYIPGSCLVQSTLFSYKYFQFGGGIWVGAVHWA